MGVETNVNFLIDLASHSAFRAGDVHTGFIPEHFDSLFPPIAISDTVLCQAAVALMENEYAASQMNRKSVFGNCANANPFNIERGVRLNTVSVRQFKLKFNNAGELAG